MTKAAPRLHKPPRVRNSTPPWAIEVMHWVNQLHRDMMAMEIVAKQLDDSPASTVVRHMINNAFANMNSIEASVPLLPSMHIVEK